MNDDVSALEQRLRDLHDAHATGFVDDQRYAESRAYLERKMAAAVNSVSSSAPASSRSAPAEAVDAVPDGGALTPARGRGMWWGGGLALVAMAGAVTCALLALEGGVVVPHAAKSAVPVQTEAAILVDTPALESVTLPPAPAPHHPPVTGTSISGQVAIEPGLAARVSPEDTVFVFARAVDGPPMPLAVLRKQVKDLPLHFTFDDSMAMWPDAKVSGFARVVVTARVSKSGEGQARPGDLEGQSAVVAPGASGLEIRVGTVVSP